MYPSTKFLHIRMIKKALSVFFAQMRLRSQLTNRCPLLRQHIESQHETLHRPEEETRVRGGSKRVKFKQDNKMNWNEFRPNTLPSAHLNYGHMQHIAGIVCLPLFQQISRNALQIYSKHYYAVLQKSIRFRYAHMNLIYE